jgi:hypothetical protein
VYELKTRKEVTSKQRRREQVLLIDGKAFEVACLHQEDKSGLTILVMGKVS